jgi:hypothetical protein
MHTPTDRARRFQMSPRWSFIHGLTIGMLAAIVSSPAVQNYLLLLALGLSLVYMIAWLVSETR